MADYNVDFSAPQGAGASPVEAVQPISGNAPNPWANVVAAGLNIFQKVKEQTAKEEKQAAKDAIIKDFVKENNTVIDAVNTGQMTRAAAAIHQRSIFSKYSANYSGMVKDFGDISKDLNSYTELGEFREEEQSQQETYRKQRDEAASAGYPITKDMNPQTEALMIASNQTNKREAAELEKYIKRTTEARAQGDYQRREAEYDIDKNIIIGLNKMGKDMVPATLSYITDLSKQNATIEQKKGSIAKLDAHFAFIDSNIAQIATGKPGLASLWKSTFDELRKNGRELIDGTLDEKSYRAMEQSLKSRIQIMALQSDPQFQALYAQNALLGNVFSTSQAVNDAALRNLSIFTLSGGVDGELPKVVGDPRSESFLIDTVGVTMDKIQNGTAANPEVEKKQAANVLDNYMKQFARISNEGADPKTLSKAMNFFASPKFLQAMEMGLVSKEQAQIVKSTNALYFEQRVMGAVSQKLGETFEGQQTYGDVVEIRWGGDHAVAVPLDRYMTPAQAAKRGMLIRELAPVLENLSQVTRAAAHLAGTGDYGKTFEEGKATWLPEYFSPDGQPLRAKGRDTGIKPIKGVVQRVAKEDLVAGETRIGNHIYKGGDPDKESSWQIVK